MKNTENTRAHSRPHRMTRPQSIRVQINLDRTRGRVGRITQQEKRHRRAHKTAGKSSLSVSQILEFDWLSARDSAGRTQDLWHSFSQYGPPGRQITHIYFLC